MDESCQLQWAPGRAVSAIWSLPAQFAGTAVVLAHGAGNDLHQPLLAHLARALPAHGVAVLRFNFPYVDAGRRTPDANSRLRATFRAALAGGRERFGSALRCLVAGGKSMGARVAAQLAGEGEPLNRLLFLGYPLHASGSERLRDQYLRAARQPMLFVQGERDPLCRLELLHPVLATLAAPVGLHEVPGGDHSFKLPAALGGEQDATYQTIAAAVAGWLPGAGALD